MDSVHEARWLLGPVFALYFIFAGIGMFVA
jgi:hypothetical protein